MEPTKAEFVAEIAEHSGESQATVSGVLKSFVDLVNEHVKNGDTVGLPELGKFEAVSTAAREGINPATGEALHIPASYRPKFKAAARLKASAKA